MANELKNKFGGKDRIYGEKLLNPKPEFRDLADEALYEEMRMMGMDYEADHFYDRKDNSAKGRHMPLSYEQSTDETGDAAYRDLAEERIAKEMELVGVTPNDKLAYNNICSSFYEEIWKKIKGIFIKPADKRKAPYKTYTMCEKERMNDPSHPGSPFYHPFEE